MVLQKRGVSLINARRCAFTLGAGLMTGMGFVGFVESPYAAVALLCLGGFAHQTLSVTVITMSSDLFKRNEVATVAGMAGTFGNAGRNSLVGPGMVTWDFSLHKDFRTVEKQRLEFRWELFNAANHPVWATPNVNANAPQQFGAITGTRINMRQMQFALKYVF